VKKKAAEVKGRSWPRENWEKVGRYCAFDVMKGRVGRGGREKWDKKRRKEGSKCRFERGGKGEAKCHEKGKDWY